MKNLAEGREEFSGWACGLGRTSVTVEELHGNQAVEVTVPRPEEFSYCDGMPVRVLHIHQPDGHETVELLMVS